LGEIEVAKGKKKDKNVADALNIGKIGFDRQGAPIKQAEKNDNKNREKVTHSFNHFLKNGGIKLEPTTARGKRRAERKQNGDYHPNKYRG
jgi:hypothetical protein